MTAPRDYRDFLNDMIVACRSLIKFVEGMSLEAYSADAKTRYAVNHGFEILGEAVRHIPDAVKAANPDIPWGTMTKVRNQIIHGYFGIDDSILYSTIHRDVAQLLPRLEKLAWEHGVAP